MKIRILLVDDHRLFRDGLRTLLDNEPGFSVVGEAENGRDAISMVEELRPDVVVMDISMPGMNGIEATSRIVSQFSESRVIALTMHEDRRFVSGALQAGALGFLLKDCAFEEFVNAIHSVMDGQTYLSATINKLVVEDYRDQLRNTDGSARALLTPREREVLQGLAEGGTTKSIAGSLGISVKTVETFRALLMEKLKIHSIAELTKYAIREGFTTL